MLEVAAGNSVRTSAEAQTSKREPADWLGSTNSIGLNEDESAIEAENEDDHYNRNSARTGKEMSCGARLLAANRMSPTTNLVKLNSKLDCSL